MIKINAILNMHKKITKKMYKEKNNKTMFKGTITKEQHKILEFYKKKHNIYIQSGPGCGKTSTSLLLAKKNKDRNFLLLTYNARLKNESRDKIKKYKLENMISHSFHSIGYNYYDNKGMTIDKKLKKIINKNFPIKKNNEINFDTIIIDECQDLKELYYHFLCKFFKDCVKKFQFIIIGDVNQSIYMYDNSDFRYLTLSKYLYDKYTKTNNWIELTLSQSFRITKNIANFINMYIIMNKNTLLKSEKVINPKIHFIDCSTYKSGILFNRIENIFKLNNIIYPKDKIFIISRSSRLKSSEGKYKPLNYFLKVIPSKKYLIYHCDRDYEKSSKNIQCMKNKICSLTFHGSKGLECDVAIIFGYGIYENNKPKKFIDELGERNCRYVGCSRPRKLLIIIKDEKNKHFSNLSHSELKSNENVKFLYDNSECKSEGEYKRLSGNINKYVTRVVENLNAITSELLLSELKIANILNNENISYKIKNILLFKNPTNNIKYKEDVCDLNGIFIQSLLELVLTNKISLVEHYLSNTANDITDLDKNNIHEYINKYYSKLKKVDKNKLTQNDINSLLYLCSYTNFIKNKTYFRFKQILNHNWIDLKICISIMNNFINILNLLNIDHKNKKNVKTEYSMNDYVDNWNINILGSIDFLFSNNIILELKHVNYLQDKHIFQTVLYGLMLGKKKVYLYNTSTHNLKEITILKDKKYYYDIILNNQINKKLLTDEEFISYNKNLVK